MLLGIVIMTAFIPNVVGAVSPTGWAVMWLAMPIYLLKCKIEMTSIHWLGLAFLSYAVLSLAWSPHGYLDLLQWLAIASVFVWSASLKDIKPVVIGLAIGLSASAILAICQYFGYGFDVFKITMKPAGLFVNSNVFAETSALVLILLLIHKLWWLIPVTVPGLLVSSRAVVLGLAVSFLVWAWHKSKLLAISCFSLGVLLTTQMSIRSSTEQHLGLWQDTFEGITLFGHGIGSFKYDFPLYAQHLDILKNRPDDAHNDLLQLAFEFGIGIIPLLVIIFKLLKVSDNHVYALIFFLVVSCFAFPLHMPVEAFILALVAGQLAYRSLHSGYTIYGVRPTISNWLEEEGRGHSRISGAVVSIK